MKFGSFGACAAVAALSCVALPAAAQDVGAEVEDTSAAETAENIEQEEMEAAEPMLEAAEEAAVEVDAASAPVQELTIAKLTPIMVELLDEVSSATAQRGDTFGLRLVTPIAVGDRVVVPAGVEGGGEVVHAKKRGSGAGGELILAARYLDHDGQRIPLRSMKMMAQGNDQTGKQEFVSAAVGVFGLMVKGQDTVIVPGRMAQAKIAKDTPVALAGQSVESATDKEAETALAEAEAVVEAEVATAEKSQTDTSIVVVRTSDEDTSPEAKIEAESE